MAETPHLGIELGGQQVGLLDGRLDGGVLFERGEPVAASAGPRT